MAQTKQLYEMSNKELTAYAQNADLNDEEKAKVIKKLSERLLSASEPNDYYTGVHEDGVVNDGDYLADKISDYVNGKAYSKPNEHLFKRLCVTEHRYLQGEIYVLLVARLIKSFAESYDKGLYDGRNKYALASSKVLSEYLDSEEFSEKVMALTNRF